MKRLGLIGAGLASVLILIQAAFPPQAPGHAFPVRSNPRVGSTVTSPPDKLTIWFDSEIEAAFSTIAVYNAAKQRVDNNHVRVNSSDATVLEVDLAPLPPGTYLVSWKVLAKDTHVTEGNFSFTVAG